MLDDKRYQPAVLRQPDLAPPPQKLKPIRCLVKPSSEDPHPLDILAGSLDRLPEMGGFLEVGCFDAPLGSNIADVEVSGQLITRGFGKGELEIVLQGRVSRHRASRDGVSLR